MHVCTYVCMYVIFYLSIYVYVYEVCIFVCMFVLIALNLHSGVAASGPGQWDKLIDFLYFLNTSSQVDFLSEIEQRVDLPSLLKGLVVESFLMGDDGFVEGLNYYVSGTVPTHTYIHTVHKYIHTSMPHIRQTFKSERNTHIHIYIHTQIHAYM